MTYRMVLKHHRAYGSWIVTNKDVSDWSPALKRLARYLEVNGIQPNMQDDLDNADVEIDQEMTERPELLPETYEIHSEVEDTVGRLLA